ncbi:MAG: hypothetical protein JNL21_03305 [Myxococcales bacterium]|nr:hypothetical protein [Myxococcales bacterium]
MKRGWTLVAAFAVVGCRSAAEESSAATASNPLGIGDEIDAVDESGTTLRFRIDAFEPDTRDRDGEVTLYALSYRRSDDAEYQPYCAPDAEGRRLAIPVVGSWDTTGKYDDAPGRVTFACTNGAIAKCVRFGYKPWKSIGGRSLAQHHLACVRMVRADYCGDGHSHTREGTRIDLWDEVGVQGRDAVSAEPEVFEAAWSPDGAAYLAVPRWSDDVQEIIGHCPERLRGRTSKDVVLPPDAVSARFPDALLFNARFVNDEQRLR